MTSPSKLLPTLASLSLALAIGACADGGYDAGSSSTGGGNVGFGGAQDFGQFRDILDQGLIPAASTLDANGFFAEHYTELPPADCGQAICVHGMVSVNPAWSDDAGTTILRVALSTTVKPEDLVAQPRDIVVVVDTSGSMLNDDRMEYVKDGLDLLIEELGEEDRLGIVTYSDQGLVRAELGAFSKLELHDVVTSLYAAGGTNIYGGLELGMQMAAATLATERQSRVILLSDGNITAGPGAIEVTAMSETYVADGIGLTTVGVGNNFNLDLMQGLAETGAGNFYYLEDPEAVAEVFTEELAYFSQPIAVGLEVGVRTPDSHRIGEVIGTRLWEAGEADSAHSGSLKVPALFLSSRVETEPSENGRRGGGSSIYIALDRAEGVAVGDSLATVTASFRLPGSAEVITQEIEVVNAVGDELPEEGYVSHLEMRKAYAVYNIFMGLRQACQEAEFATGDSLATIRSLIAAATEWNTRVPDADISDDMALLAQFEANLQANGYGGEEYPSDQTDYDYAGEDPVMCSSSGSGLGGTVFAFLLLACVTHLRRRRN